MIDNPVGLRELRLAAQSMRTYRARTGLVFGGIVGVGAAFACFHEIGRRSNSLLGQTVFFVSAWAVFFIAASSFGATADAVSSEKRSGTLGLLFLTHLKGRDVILGKLLANGLSFFAGILALFPILTGPLLLGGVSFWQCVRLFCSVGNVMLFSAAAGLLASTFCVGEQVAKSKAFQIVLLFVGGLPLATRIMRYFGCDPTLCLAIDLVSPLYAQRSALGGLAGPQLGWFCISAGTVFSLSCAMLAAASWMVPRSWQDGVKASLAEIASAKIRDVLRRTIPARSKMGAALLERNPFEWLAIRDQSLRTAMVLVIAASLFLVVALHPILSLYWSQAGFSLLVSLPLLLILTSIVKIRLGRLAVKHIAGAKENQVLESIMGSRVRMEEIVSAQFRALRNLLALPLLTLVALHGAALAYSLPGIDHLADTFTSPPEIGEYRLRAATIVAAVLFFLFLDTIALTWTGMFCAFKFPRTGKAHSWTGFFILAVPNMLFLLAVTVIAQFNTMRPYLETFYPPVALWVAIKLGNDLLMITYARVWLLNVARSCLDAPLEQTRDDKFFMSREAFGQLLRRQLAFFTRSAEARK